MGDLKMVATAPDVAQAIIEFRQQQTATVLSNGQLEL